MKSMSLLHADRRCARRQKILDIGGEDGFDSSGPRDLARLAFFPSRVPISEQTLEFSARFALATCDWARDKNRHSGL